MGKIWSQGHSGHCQNLFPCSYRIDVSCGPLLAPRSCLHCFLPHNLLHLQANNGALNHSLASNLWLPLLSPVKKALYLWKAHVIRSSPPGLLPYIEINCAFKSNLIMGLQSIISTVPGITSHQDHKGIEILEGILESYLRVSHRASGAFKFYRFSTMSFIMMSF